VLQNGFYNSMLIPGSISAGPRQYKGGMEIDEIIPGKQPQDE